MRYGVQYGGRYCTLTSSTGVPSTRSQPHRWMVRVRLSILSILARVTPTGLGLWGERVANTPTFFFSIGGLIFALKVDLEEKFFDSLRVLVFK